MDLGLSLQLIPPSSYATYKSEVIFKSFKWDPQVGDVNTIARYALVLDKTAAQELEKAAEQLTAEVFQLEQALLNKLHLAAELGLAPKVRRQLKRIKEATSQQHIRLMRFDFHPTSDGWRISEVNSDVPAGEAENSTLPKVALPYLKDCHLGKNVVEKLALAFQTKTPADSLIALVHATAYADDRQIASCLAAGFSDYGLPTVLVAPDHLEWEQRQAYLKVNGLKTGGIYRHFPFEWLPQLADRACWLGYFDCLTPCCNPAIAVLSQSKRLPLIWDQLAVDIPAWRQLLPPTRSIKDNRKENNWIFKPAYGRVGDGITITGALEDKEERRIKTAVRHQRKYWLQQQRFESQTLAGINDERFHLCLGVYSVDGQAAGFYGRISEYPRIDERAQDIAVLIKGRE